MTLTPIVLAVDSSSVILGKTLGALERAHNAHDFAKEVCSLHPRPLGAGPPQNAGETVAVNWDYIEKETRQLAEKGAKASELLPVLGSLRTERRALFEDFLGCYAKNNPEAVLAARPVAVAIASLDDVASDLEHELWNRWYCFRCRYS
jgi:hypothetical protein